MSGFSWGEMFAHMGVFAWTVVAVLFLMSLISLTIAIERWWSFRRMRLATLDFLPAVTRHLETKDLKKAVEETRRHNRSHLARVLAAGIHEFANHEMQHEEFDLIDSVERSLERSQALTAAELRRGLPVLATVASTAPFVGLLGTVLGIITAFQGMAAAGSGGLGEVSAGIAEALVTTAFGLFVAILAVWLYNYFTARIEYFQVEMTNSASELMAYFLKKLGQTPRVAAAR